MSGTWNYMVDFLSGELTHLDEKDDQMATDMTSVYVEQVILPRDAIITYHAKQSNGKQ